MKKKRYMVFVLIFSMLFYTGCHYIQDEKLPPAEKPTLNFRITWDSYSGRGEAIKSIIDVYNARPSSKSIIQLVGGNENREQTNKLLEETGKDTIFVLPYRYIKAYGLSNALSTLNPAFNAYKDLYYDEIWAMGIVDHQLYGIPWIGHSICLLYNESLLKQANIAPEEIDSLDAFVKALEAVQSHTNAKGIGLVGAEHNDVSWMVNQFIYGFGSQLVDSVTSEVVINNQMTADAIRFYRDVLGAFAQENWEHHSGLNVMKLFLEQQVAFEFQGVWGVTDIYKNGRPFEVGIILPSKIGLKSEVGPLMLSIPSNMSQENQILANDFIHFLLSEEAQTGLMKGEYSPEHDSHYPFRVPMRIDLHDSLIANDYSIYLPFIEGLSNPSIDVPIPEWERIKHEYYESGLHEVMIKNRTIESFLDEIEHIATQLINESRYENGD